MNLDTRIPGKLQAISLGTWIDSGNVACITPHGKLVLAVDKETYQQLGLVGKKSRFKSFQNRWLIWVDMKAHYFEPHKKYYQRVKWCLENRLTDTEFFLSWTSPRGVTEEVQFPEGVTFRKLRVKTQTRHWTHINVPAPISLLEHITLTRRRARSKPKHPVPTSNNNNNNNSGLNRQLETPRFYLDSEFVHALYDWFGCLHNRISSVLGSHMLEPFVSSFQPAIDMKSLSGVAYSFQGLLPSEFVLQQVRHFRKILAETEGSIPWISVTVWGFEDSPISWGDNQHHFLLSGENDYTIVLLPHNAYLLFIALGTHDTFS